MKVTGSSIQQLDKLRKNGTPMPRSECRRWRLWASTEEGRKSRRFEGTYTQAQKALAAFVAELERHVPNPDTFGAYAESWRLWREKSGGLAPGTIQNDRREVTALRRTALDGMRMDAIGPADVRDALLWLKSHPARGGGELSNTTMNSIHICCKAIFQQEVDDGRLTGNPMARMKPPKPDTKERDALTPDELALLVMRLGELPLDGRTMALYLMALLGLRRGEACGLMVDDLDGNIVHVRRAVKERDGAIAEPKSKAGVRSLPMPPLLRQKVDEWLALRARLGFADSPTLCCNTEGGVLRPQLLQRWWAGDSVHSGVRDSIGCGGMTLHQLRHSNLSMMARHMSPFDLQRYAGWSSIAPAKVYIHDDMDAVARAVEGAWGGADLVRSIG